MASQTYPWWSRALGAALLAGSLGACDFIESTSSDPNNVPDATLDQHAVAIQVNSYYFAESQIGRLAAMWTQQMAGTDRQFVALDQYVFTDEESDGEFSQIYVSGGLIDIRRAIDLAQQAGRSPYVGFLKIHEAYLIGMGASVFGDLPYSEAGDAQNPEPKLDDQAEVYDAIQRLLDEAIADLGGEGLGPGSMDLNFGGSVDRWRAVAHTLKARYEMHWAEVRGEPAYRAALAAAQNGIKSANGTWKTIHSEVATEQNLWHQFMRDRSGYISSGDHLIPLMVTRNDPRLPFYFSTVDGAYTPRKSVLSLTGFGAPDWRLPIVSCAENQFIIAEAQYQLGDEAAARAAAKDALACEEAEYGVDLTSIKNSLDGLSGDALFDEIMNQKYTALFLNIEAWNDYKRTCRPAILPKAGKTVPGRLFYGQTERQANPNIPDESGDDPGRNDNDPNPCPAPSAA